MGGVDFQEQGTIAQDQRLGCRWSGLQLVGFRFLFVYVLLYVLRNLPLGWQPLIDTVGTGLFGLEAPVRRGGGGSGDGIGDYVQIFCILVLAALITGIWIAFDRRRAHHRLLHGWLRIVVRFWVGIPLIAYGVAKILPAQFPPPSPVRLMLPLGDATPMGLLWAFMGHSPAYAAFSGLAEVLGAGLLFFRRTVTLGALILVGVLANVVMLNLCYDVPLKINSLHFLGLTLFLLAPDLRRLARVLVLNRATDPAPPELPRFEGRRGKIAVWAGKIGALAVAALLTTVLVFQRGLGREHPLAGIYQVSSFAGGDGSGGVGDGAAVGPGVLVDGARWVQVVMDGRRFGAKLETGDLRRFKMSHDPRHQRLTLTDAEGTSTAFVLEPIEGGFGFSGSFGDGPMNVRLRRLGRDQGFPLVERGFHWINPFPLSR